METLKNEQVDKVASIAQGKMTGEKATKAEYFIRQFYADVLEDDILGTDLEDLYGSALSLMQFGSSRPGGELKVRAYNPQFEKYGWRCAHTVIEIINDDMPFLVDSVTIALNALNLTVHLVIHPIFQVKRADSGKLFEISDGRKGKNGAVRESFMQIHVDEQTAPEALREIEETIRRVLAD
ncbi:MAG: NAD-glutamate dehydrogenase, partial [Alphaproteobacteria bacterium]|nr:NAD-glutamate dehydrogenase [Alphaproteobacteria bacterium]